MSRAVPSVPIVVVAALVLLPSGEASHLSMDMPGLGGATVSPPSLVLLAATALAALFQGAWLLRAVPRARDAGLGLALAPLAVSAARTSSLAPSADGRLAGRIADAGGAASEHLWALLAVVALAVGFGAARTLEAGIAWRTRGTPEPARVARAAGALVLTLPFVSLIVATSTGVDWVSSWIRWGGCGVAAIVCVTSALVPGRGDSRVLPGVTFVLAALFSLLAEREYVEALGHDALLHRDPFDPGVEWVRGLREIAGAVEPRERYGLVALLPWLALLPGTRWRPALPRLASGLAVLSIGVLGATAISGALDASARALAGPATSLGHEELAEIVWSTRALPRTALWVRAMRPPHAPDSPPVPPVCAAWSAPAPTDG